MSAFVIGRDALDAFGRLYPWTRAQSTGWSGAIPSIDDQGRLLGTVIEADLTSCRVLTILHPSFNAAGVVSRTRDKRHPDRGRRLRGRGAVRLYRPVPGVEWRRWGMR